MRNLVVGVDGTRSSRRALEWAADTVGPHGQLHAVTAVSPATEIAVDAALGDSTTYRRLLKQKLSTVWTSSVRGRVGTMTTTAADGTASDALTVAAGRHRCDAIVVGAHVPPRSMPKRIGATTRQLLRELEFPLVVVPSGAEGGLSHDRPLIVGIGHSEATESAVRWAARLADQRGLGVGLVRATGEGPVFQVDGLIDLLTYYIDPAQRDVWTRDDLARFAEAVQSMTAHEVPIGVSAVPGLPATRLVEASEGASLLVIGQHRSSLTGTRHVVQPLRYALTHARCPVAVVPVAGAATDTPTHAPAVTSAADTSAADTSAADTSAADTSAADTSAVDRSDVR